MKIFQQHRIQLTKLVAVAACSALLVLSGCSSIGSGQAKDAATAEPEPAKLQHVSIVLDWTPNTNHTGVYVAQQQGLYKKAGLDVEIQGYSKAGVEAVLSNGGADFGFTGSSGIASANAAGENLKMVYNLQQRASNGITVMASSAFKRPKDLDGKIFATYGAGDTGNMARKVIKADGGTGVFDKVVVGTGSYEAVAQGKADFAEGLSTWEGLEYELHGTPLRFFYPDEYGVETTPCMIGIGASAKLVKENPELVKKFIQATKAGYDYALKNPDEAAKILVEANPQAKIDPELAKKSQEMLSGGFWKDSRGETGLADINKWQVYLDYLANEQVITGPQGKPLEKPQKAEDLVTNEFVK